MRRPHLMATSLTSFCGILTTSRPHSTLPLSPLLQSWFLRCPPTVSRLAGQVIFQSAHPITQVIFHLPRRRHKLLLSKEMGFWPSQGFVSVALQAMSFRSQRAQKWRDMTTSLRDSSAFPKEGRGEPVCQEGQWLQRTCTGSGTSAPEGRK